MTDADSSIDQDRNAFASHAAEFWRLLFGRATQSPRTCNLPLLDALRADGQSAAEALNPSGLVAPTAKLLLRKSGTNGHLPSYMAGRLPTGQ